MFVGRRHRRCLAAATALLIANPTPAEEVAVSAEPRTWVQLQGTAASWRMQTRGDAAVSGSEGTPLQTETDLGLPRHRSFTGIAFGRRIGERWRFELGYENVRREGSTVLARDIEADGVVFAAGTPLRSEIGLRTLRINAGWSLLLTEADEAGLLLGGQWFDVSRRFEGQGRRLGDDPASPVAPLLNTSGDIAPVVLIGLFGGHALSPQWRVNARAEFGLGGYRHGVVATQWRASPNLALGVGYRYTRAELDVLFGFVACCSRLVLDYRMHGPTLTLDLLF